LADVLRNFFESYNNSLLIANISLLSISMNYLDTYLDIRIQELDAIDSTGQLSALDADELVELGFHPRVESWQARQLGTIACVQAEAASRSKDFALADRYTRALRVCLAIAYNKESPGERQLSPSIGPFVCGEGVDLYLSPDDKIQLLQLMKY
jgi:hypothetical protein